MTETMVERVATIRQSQEFAWRARLIEWLVPRLSRDKEATIDMVQSGLSAAFNEGIREGATTIRLIAAGVDGPDRHRVLNIVARALDDLAARNEADAALSEKQG